MQTDKQTDRQTHCCDERSSSGLTYLVYLLSSHVNDRCTECTTYDVRTDTHIYLPTYLNIYIHTASQSLTCSSGAADVVHVDRPGAMMKMQVWPHIPRFYLLSSHVNDRLSICTHISTYIYREPLPPQHSIY